MANLYSYKYADKIVALYQERGGNVIAFDGALVDSLLCYGDRLKTTVMREVYINEYSSALSMRKYNKTPKKYAQIIEAYESGDVETATQLFFS